MALVLIKVLDEQTFTELYVSNKSYHFQQYHGTALYLTGSCSCLSS